MHNISELKKKTHLDRIPVNRFFPFKIKLGETNVELLLACIVGIIAGYASVFFRFLLHQMHDFFFIVVYGWLSQISPYLLPLIPMFGAMLLIPFSLRYPGEINGYGMPKFLISVHLKGGLVRTRAIFIKIFTAAITISTGGAAGVEGPIALIGGAVGSSVGRFFEMGSQRLKVLIACGSAAGIAAQFNAPLAGVLFAQEIIMVGNFQLQTFGVIVIASGLATAISRAYYSAAPTFGNLEYTLNSLYELPFYILLGLIVGVLAYLFIRLFFGISDRFEQLKMHAQLKPIFGAFLVGLLGLINFGVLGDGYEVIIASLETSSGLTLAVVALLVVLKMIATSITLGSGNVGGVFAPCLFIGAMIGSTFGGILKFFLPGAGIQQGSYALVGMGAFLAAATHAPMTAIFLLFELTNNYQVIIPIMFASVIGVMVARHFCDDSLDSMELSRRGISLHAGREESILNSIQVESVMVREYETIRENMSFAEFMKFFPTSKSQYYPVMNEENRMTGVVSFQDIREILLEEGLEHLVVMKELAETRLIKLHPHDNLSEAIKKFGIKDIEAIPVVHPEDPGQLLGILKRKDVINAYNKAILMRELSQQH
ncbi:MAG: Cl- channel voltage-gated family protein [SAR324 cluster bacterium]|uniref:Cl-channel voltage-gated family protein n=1 Tax=SAR324 cluster bacterium TaxID=2024889 RepID=A0A2A4STF0_9DELT|nr:MAG: Cl- channel voltage-gated family protein [SAR324 cluster bacterium]